MEWMDTFVNIKELHNFYSVNKRHWKNRRDIGSECFLNKVCKTHLLPIVQRFSPNISIIGAVRMALPCNVVVCVRSFYRCAMPALNTKYTCWKCLIFCLFVNVHCKQIGIDVNKRPDGKAVVGKNAKCLTACNSSTFFVN